MQLSAVDTQCLTAPDRQMSACLSVFHTSPERKIKKKGEMTMINSPRARFVPNVTGCFDGLSDPISFISYLICFSTECYVGHKWPTNGLNEYGLLIAVRRHPGSHEICARTHDH